MKTATTQVAISDDALPSSTFEAIRYALTEDLNFPWYRQTQVSGHDAEPDHYFTHNFYWNNRPNSSSFGIFEPVIVMLGVKALVRVKANLYPRESVMRHHAWHRDFPELVGSKVALLYVNTNNGVTELRDGTVIDSVANRIASFGHDVEHRSSVCTDELARITVNINYY